MIESISRQGQHVGKMGKMEYTQKMSLRDSLLVEIVALLVLLLLGLASCADSDALPADPAIVRQGFPVEVTLNLSVTQETDAAGPLAATRVVDDSDSPPHSLVKNVWALQFNGQDDNAVLAGVPAYIDNTAGNTCRLLEGTGQTIWFLANTFDTGMRWEANLTLGALKNRYMNISGEAVVHGRGAATVTPEAGYPDDANYYLILNGIWQGDISAATDLQCTLIRNTARVDFLLKNMTTGGGAVTINTVQLCSVMARSYLYTGYGLPAVFPAGDPYLETIDYAPVAWEKGTDGGNGYTRFRFYLPPNMRGIRSSITQSKDKNEYHPALATYMVVRGTYQESGQSVPVTYTVYPGADLTSDFNLKPDHAYTCTLDINGHDSSADPRVRTFGTRDFAADGQERANCYILNPAPAGTRQFRIPVDRINVFWGNRGYQNVSVNTLAASDNWTAEILWCDFERSNDPSDANYFALTKAMGTGADGAADGYFTAEAGPGADGNVLVAVKKGGTILWSWHLWITDYDPYAASIPSTDANAQITDVPGGVVTRFSTIAFDGKYMVIMDRCLGQSKARPADQPLYQFGRKDPFAYSQADGAALFTSNLGASLSRLASVLSPTLRAEENAGANADWLLAGEKRGYEWDDPNLTSTTYIDYESKSLFDPCPPGWKVPRTQIRLGPRAWTYSINIYRLFNIQGVRWTWVYEARCWMSNLRSTTVGYVAYNGSQFAAGESNATYNARARLLGIIPERMKY